MTDITDIREMKARIVVLGVGGAGGPRELEIVYAECGERRVVLIDASVAFAECLPVRGFPS